MIDREVYMPIMQSELRSLNGKIDTAISNFSKTENKLLKELQHKLQATDIEDQLTAAKIILQILQHPPLLDLEAYSELSKSLETKHPQNFVKKILATHPKTILKTLDIFLLEVLDIRRQDQLFNQRSLRLSTFLSKHKLNPYYTIIGNFLNAIDDSVVSLRPDVISPTNVLPYLTHLKATNDYLEEISSAMNPVISALREDQLTLPDDLNPVNSVGRNQFHFDYYVAKIKEERARVAKECYPSIEQFLKSKSTLREYAEGKRILLWSSCNKFCNQPSIENLQDLEFYIHTEKQLSSFKERRMLNAFLKEASEISYHYHHHELQKAISTTPKNSPVFTAAKRCLEEVDELKSKQAKTTTFLTDKLAIMAEAIKKPLIANHRLAEKAKEVARSGLKIFAGSMLCLLSATLFVASAYATVQTGLLAWPITLATSKLSFAIMGIGAGMMIAGGVSLAKSVGFFANTLKKPKLQIEMDNLSKIIADENKQAPRP